MEQLKRKRAGQAGNLTRIQNKLQKIRGKDTSTLNLQLLEKYLADIISTDEAYRRWHAAIEEQFVDQIDTTEEDNFFHHTWILTKRLNLLSMLILRC